MDKATLWQFQPEALGGLVKLHDFMSAQGQFLHLHAGLFEDLQRHLVTFQGLHPNLHLATVAGISILRHELQNRHLRITIHYIYTHFSNVFKPLKVCEGL